MFVPPKRRCNEEMRGEEGMSNNLTIPGSIVMFNLATAFVMTSSVFILNFVKFRIADYVIMFLCFAYLSRFIGIEQPLSQIYGRWGLPLSALIVFIIILAMYKIRLKKLEGNLFFCWFTCMFVFISGYTVSYLFPRSVLRLGQVQETRIEALFVWGIALLVVCSLSAALVYAIKRLFKRHFDNINKMGKAYPLIERFIIINSIAIFILVGLAYYFFGGMRNPIFNFTHIILLFAMALQLSFIIVVFRITYLKDNLKATAMENQSLAVYSSSLEKSMNDIKNIKHDVKNIFLTMGAFVERSDDKEMQEFYSKKISPFAVDEIAKNDLLGKLTGLGNEQLKAFMFYKISQGIERDVDIELDIATEIPKMLTVESIDLVRILGILLDNAIEECVEIPDGRIQIKISRNDEMVSYVIKNTVRQEIKKKGVKLGVSTKGKDRGKGLLGVRSIIDRYDTVLLNSYFSEKEFVQNLVIYSE